MSASRRQKQADHHSKSSKKDGAFLGIHHMSGVALRAYW